MRHILFVFGASIGLGMGTVHADEAVGDRIARLAHDVAQSPHTISLRILYAEALAETGDRARAETELLVAASLAPHDPTVHEASARLALEAREFDEALARVAAARDLGARSVGLALLEAEANERLDRLHEAESAYADAVALGAGVDAFHAWGALLASQRRPLEAIDVLEWGVDRTGSAGLRDSIVRIAIGHDQPARALPHVEALVRASAAPQRAILLRGRLLAMLGRDAEARADFARSAQLAESALALHPTAGEQLVLAEALAHLGSPRAYEALELARALGAANGECGRVGALLGGGAR